MSEQDQAWSAAWDPFLVGKRRMLQEFRRAREHASTLPVQVHHGVVGEAAVRSWLEEFLPRRYGVTAGYIRGQRIKNPAPGHFDVIVYDRLNSPVLWTESNPDKSEAGRARIIPAEYVRAVFEVKARFDRNTVNAAVDKLQQLSPFMAAVDGPEERYPTYIPANAVLVLLFIELRREDRSDFEAVDRAMATAALQRATYGPVILAGEGIPDDRTGVMALTASEEPIQQLVLANGLLEHVYLHPSTPTGSDQHVGAMLTWSDLNFSAFAFDLLALMDGTYRHGFTSSFHGIDLNKYGG